MTALRTATRFLALVIAAMLLLFSSNLPPAAGLPVPAKEEFPWVGTWSAAPAPPETSGISQEGFNNETVRMVARTSVGGSQLRVRLSNEFGTGPVTFTAASVGLRHDGPDLVRGSYRRLTFADGRESVTVRAGAAVYSDVVHLVTSALDEVAVSVHVAGASGPVTWHSGADSTTWIADGDQTGDLTGDDFDETVPNWFWLSGIDVSNTDVDRTVVALGNSITDGSRSTLDAFAAYPDFLAERLLAAASPDQQVSVLNMGIGGNRILNDPPPALQRFGVKAVARFDRDVLVQTGATDVILLEGINDIGFSAALAPDQDVSAAEIIEGMKNLISRAHARGVRIYGGTILPFEGAGYFSEAGEAKRQAVNEWIRTSGAFDAVIDFDAAMRDPANPRQLLDAYDSGDNLHPNDAGYAAMAAAVDLTLFGIPLEDHPWAGTWSTSPLPASATGRSQEGFEDETVRMVTRVSVGGQRLRVRLSNEFGIQPVTFNAATVALQDEGANVQDPPVPVTFGGEAAVTVRPGARVYSDIVDLAFPDEADIVVSVYTSEDTGPATWHSAADATTWIADGDQTADTSAEDFDETVTNWFWLTGLDVQNAAVERTIVALGDSITDGSRSTVDANARYPDFLARRLLEEAPDDHQVSVLNEGIGGNRILHDLAGIKAVARFDRDVLAQTGVTDVILLEGINDIGFSAGIRPEEEVSAAEIIEGMKNLIARTQAKGLRIYGGTILPFEGAGYFTEAGEAKRQAVNRFIRYGGLFDGVIDFDAAMRDPANPRQLLDAYDSGDNLHPNDAGYAAMAAAVDLGLFDVRHCTNTGTDRADVLVGTRGDDVICGFGGNDVIHGGGGHDVIYGDDGDDLLHGADGDDRLWGGSGLDRLWGRGGNDYLRGNDGDDRLWGGDGDDALDADEGRDRVLGGRGNDGLAGGEDDDELVGVAGDNLLYGNAGNDLLVAILGGAAFDGGADVDRCIGSPRESNEAVACEQMSGIP